MFEVVAMVIVYAVALAMLVCSVIAGAMVAYEIKDRLHKRQYGGLIEIKPSDSIDHLDWTVR